MRKPEEPSLASLFTTFMKIGVMTFGGGYAMLPMLQREVVENHGWCTDEELLDYFAIGQCTPGIIAVNTATFVGYKERGKIGGVLTSLGVIFPSFLIILALASLLEVFESNPILIRALAGIRVAVCALITLSVVKLSKKSLLDAPTVTLSLITLIFMIFLSPSPVIFVIIGILWGILFSLLNERRRRKK